MKNSYIYITQKYNMNGEQIGVERYFKTIKAMSNYANREFAKNDTITIKVYDYNTLEYIQYYHA